MLSGDGGKDSEELPVPEVDECWAVWIKADAYEVFPVDTSEEILRHLLYIDQCRLADEECRSEVFFGASAMTPKSAVAIPPPTRKV